jgi:hypothetical protein
MIAFRSLVVRPVRSRWPALAKSPRLAVKATFDRDGSGAAWRQAW